MTAPPPLRARLAGRYVSQCPSCRTGRHFGPDCGGGGPVSARARRKSEKAALQRYVTDEFGTQPGDPFVDESDCRHGCNGACLDSQFGANDCDFTCHVGAE